MKKNTLIVSWSLYLLSAIILIIELGFRSNETPGFINLSIASLILMIPWIICIVSAIKNKKENGIWVFGLIFLGLTQK